MDGKRQQLRQGLLLLYGQDFKSQTIRQKQPKERKTVLFITVSFTQRPTDSRAEPPLLLLV